MPAPEEVFMAGKRGSPVPPPSQLDRIEAMLERLLDVGASASALSAAPSRAAGLRSEADSPSGSPPRGRATLAVGDRVVWKSGLKVGVTHPPQGVGRVTKVGVSGFSDRACVDVEGDDGVLGCYWAEDFPEVSGLQITGGGSHSDAGALIPGPMTRAVRWFRWVSRLLGSALCKRDQTPSTCVDDGPILVPMPRQEDHVLAIMSLANGASYTPVQLQKLFLVTIYMDNPPICKAHVGAKTPSRRKRVRSLWRGYGIALATAFILALCPSMRVEAAAFCRAWDGGKEQPNLLRRGVNEKVPSFDNVKIVLVTLHGPEKVSGGMVSDHGIGEAMTRSISCAVNHMTPDAQVPAGLHFLKNLVGYVRVAKDPYVSLSWLGRDIAASFYAHFALTKYELRWVGRGWHSPGLNSENVLSVAKNDDKALANVLIRPVQFQVNTSVLTTQPWHD